MLFSHLKRYARREIAKTQKTNMKKTIWKLMASILFVATLSVATEQSLAQNKKLPDGTIVYPDGSRKLPNGTVINKSGTVLKKNNNYPKDPVIRRNGDNRNVRKHRRYTNRTHLPPGQAKKVYGGSATDYAPGQQKKWRKNKKWKHDKVKGLNTYHGKPEKLKKEKEKD